VSNEKEARVELTLEQTVKTVNEQFSPHFCCSCGECPLCAWHRLQEFIETMQASAFSCPQCGSYLVKSIEDVETTFLYGESDELSCEHPVRVCLSCAYQWTDMEFEYATTEAVVRHLQQKLAELNDSITKHQCYPDMPKGQYMPEGGEDG
jgi:hypothetical protein